MGLPGQDEKDFSSANKLCNLCWLKRGHRVKKGIMHNIRYFILLVLFHPTFIGCAYTIGYRHQQLVGKYDKVSIPMFSNISKVTGAETFLNHSYGKLNEQRS